MNKNHQFNSASKSLDTRFSFISLYLFVLIFFILLMNYSKLEESEKNIKNVFKSFRGEDILDSEVILIPLSERNLVEARSYFRELIVDKIIPKATIEELTEEFEDHTVYRLTFHFNDLFYPDSSELRQEVIMMLKQMLNIEKQAYNFHLKHKMLAKAKNIFIANSLTQRRLQQYLTVVLEQDKTVPEMNAIEYQEDEQDSAIIIDLYLEN